MITKRYETVHRKDPRFFELISGEFSNTDRAIPLQSLQSVWPEEEVTFEIIAKSQLPSFSLKELLRSMLKVRHVLLLVFPIFYLIFLGWNQPQLTSVEIILILLGLLATFLAVQLRIDIRDYISGYDRLRGDQGLPLLRQGVLSVNEAKKWEQRFAGLAVGFGVIPLTLEPARLMAFIFALSGLILADWSGSRVQNRFNRDVALSLVAGPILCFGILPTWDAIAFGFVWSLILFFNLQIDHYENFFVQTKAGEKNFLNRVSFDDAGLRLWKTWATAMMVYSVWSLLKYGLSVWLVTVLILFYYGVHWRKSVLNLKSSLGSGLIKICESARQLISILILLWVSELVFRAWIAPLVFAWAN